MMMGWDIWAFVEELRATFTHQCAYGTCEFVCACVRVVWPLKLDYDMSRKKKRRCVVAAITNMHNREIYGKDGRSVWYLSVCGVCVVMYAKHAQRTTHECLAQPICIYIYIL